MKKCKCTPADEAADNQKTAIYGLEELNSREHCLITVLNSILTGVLIIDEESKKIIDCNNMAEQLIGLSKEEIVNNQCHQFICPAEKGKCPITDLHQNIDRSQRILINANSQQIPILKRVCPVCWQGHRYLIESFINITEFKGVEDALRNSEERFSKVADITGDWIWEINCEGLYTYSNPVVEKILGYKAEEIVGKKYFYDFFAPDVKEQLNKAAFEVLAKREDFLTLVNPNIHKNGSLVILETTGTPIVDENGNLCGYMGVDRDITGRKMAEQRQAELIEKVEQTNQELKDFAYVVSHDLKAPLRGITTLAEWLVQDYSDKFDQEGKEQMRLLSQRAIRMQKMIEGILQYSRIGRVREEKIVINLNELLPQIIDSIAPPASVKIIIENDLQTILFEPTPISQVFQNLLSNAIKFMDKPEGIVKIGCTDEGENLKFYVADNGCGIEEKYFGKIFQLFQCIPKQSSDSTGVGLTIVKKIIEMNGGKIWIESEFGKGSTFLFTIPKNTLGVKIDEKLEANYVS